MKKRKHYMILIILVLSLVISACSQQDDSVTEEPANNNETEETMANTEDSTNENETEDEEEEGTSNLRNEIDYTTPDSIQVLVNKDHPLPSNYEPTDLVVPDVRFPFEEDDPKKQLRKEAADALEELFIAAEEDGHYLFALSGYRSYDRQEVIFASNVNQHGEEHANTFSARAGESEHQTGLVMDISSEAVGFRLVVEFGDTPEGKWVAENAHLFGFIIRYPEGKEEITKYQYEPWHLRYVGVDVATEVFESGETYEEYLGIVE